MQSGSFFIWAKYIPLFFYMEAIILPNEWVFANILDYFFMVALISNDMIVKSSLPYGVISVSVVDFF